MKGGKAVELMAAPGPRKSVDRAELNSQTTVDPRRLRQGDLEAPMNDGLSPHFLIPRLRPQRNPLVSALQKPTERRMSGNDGHYTVYGYSLKANAIATVAFRDQRRDTQVKQTEERVQRASHLELARARPGQVRV